MARRYVRDNRGRFASSGATARGGRLKTASGGKRKGSTMKAAGGTPAGAMRGRIRRDPGAMAKARKPDPNEPVLVRQAGPQAPEFKIPKPPMKRTGPRARRAGASTAASNELSRIKAQRLVNRDRISAAQKAAKNAKSPVEKLQAQSRVNEYRLNEKRLKDKEILVKARPLSGRPITGRDRYGYQMSATRANRPTAIRGTVKRDPSARSKAPAGMNTDAGRYRRVYAMNANKAAAAASKRRRR